MLNRHFFVTATVFFTLILISLIVIIVAGVFGDFIPDFSGGGETLKKIFKF